LAALLACLSWIGPSAAQTATPGSPAPLAICAACHGAQGQGAVAGFPRLAGQNADYLAQALSKFRDKSRASDIMQPMAQGLSDDQIQQLAAYFSAQRPMPLVASQPPPAAELVEAGQQLAHSGAPHVASCFSCHGSDGRGVGARFPAIVGQPALFVIARLHEFQARAKAGGAKPGTMTEVSAGMTEAQIQESAAFLSVSAP
jgi:cytochrome c553